MTNREQASFSLRKKPRSEADPSGRPDLSPTFPWFPTQSPHTSGPEAHVYSPSVPLGITEKEKIV